MDFLKGDVMIYNNVELYNVHETVEDVARPGEKILCRIPETLRKSLNAKAMISALASPGAEIRFNLLGDKAAITLRDTAENEVPALVEVYQGGFFLQAYTIGMEPTTFTVCRHEMTDMLSAISLDQGMSFDIELFRVILPWRPPCRLIRIEGYTAPPRPEQTPHAKYLAYGSSITHGQTAVRPTGTYTMRVAQLLEADLVNIGFGGGAHLEPGMADYIAARQDWQFASLEMGINLIASVSPDEFEHCVTYFISTIARAHPDKWIFCIDLFPSYWDYQAGSKADHFRAVVRAAVGKLNRPKVVYLAGRDMLTLTTGLTADLLHPSPSGMEQIARNMAFRMSEAMDGKK